MDYRQFQEKYGSKLNKSLTDQEYIEYLIKTLQDEGFGTAKAVTVLDGFKTRAVKIAEDDTTITYQIDYFEAAAPAISSAIDQGSNFEWGQILNPADLTVDFTITRKTYALTDVSFTGLDQADQDSAAINTAGVNDNLNTEFAWAFTDIPNTGTLSTGETLVGTITALDDRGQTVVNSVSINRQDRYIWGITQEPMAENDIATAIATKTGAIVPGDNDIDFRELNTGLGSFPTQISVDTFGSDRTVFFCTMDPISFTLESGVPYEFPVGSVSINLGNLTGGVANVTRTYEIRSLDLNTFVTLLSV